MKCDWCRGDALRSDIASQRCRDCGGAHWSCPTPQCGRLVAECRGFCSACGSERRYPQLDGQKKPIVTACRTTGFPIRSDAASSGGFDARKTEGYSVEGRLIIAGPQHVFIAPNTHRIAATSNPALGLICETSDKEEVFSTPAPLPSRAFLISSHSRILAISVHTGEVQQIGSTGSMIRPVAAAIPKHPNSDVEIWTAAPESNAPLLMRHQYEPGACLEIGTFSAAQSSATIPNVRTGASSAGFDSEDSARVWFLAVAPDMSAEGYAFDPVAKKLKECGRHYDACTLPRTPLTRATLWWSGADSSISNCEWHWLSRGGWEDDGALPVQKMLRVQPKEIEYKAFTDSFANRAQNISLSKTRDTAIAQRAVDGVWIRTGNAVRWGWCGDETVRLTSDPGPIGWSDEALLNDVNIKPVAEQLGPLIPTQWGFAAVVAERAINGKPDAIAILYFDFPKLLS